MDLKKLHKVYTLYLPGEYLFTKYLLKKALSLVCLCQWTSWKPMYITEEKGERKKNQKGWPLNARLITHPSPAPSTAQSWLPSKNLHTLAIKTDL